MRRSTVSETVKVLVFSDDVETRRAVTNGVGLRASKDTPVIEWHEAATAFGAVELVKNHDFALLVLDAETQKEGGMSVAKELENTVERMPPILMLTARPQDTWLATWAGAARIVSEPLNPLELQEAVAALLH